MSKKRKAAQLAAAKKARRQKWITAACCAGVALAIVAAVLLAQKGDKVYTTSGNGAPTTQQQSGVKTTGSLDPNKTYFADIAIEGHGTVTIQLDQKNAPVTASNFVELAEDGFYDGLTFHRIMDGFMMQGGCPNGDGYGGADQNILGEFTSNGVKNPLSHTRGAVSMARSGDPNSASSQFFIVHRDSTFLDGDYAVFGYVTEGMEFVDAVCKAAKPTDDNESIPKTAQPVIKSITIRSV